MLIPKLLYSYLFFVFTILEPNLAPALVLCKYVLLIYLESCLRSVNDIGIMLILIQVAENILHSFSSICEPVYYTLLHPFNLDILFNFLNSIISISLFFNVMPST